MYEIGQQVVCVKTHSQGVVKEGEIYTIKGMDICKCGYLSLDVGLIDKSVPFMTCSSCHRTTLSDIWWIGSKLFRPLDDLYNTEIEQLMNEVNERQPFEI